ncbi:eukaryotic translation initiation factor 3 subunit B [Condylostylus longicornis]|uniref:eukaryotic translation initiation factor 3 subunit B n=1 Tax=Condylostylus longicornis TaxID=2530218 RepID=UPI00244D9C7E|nr:eukaryotic translation initiation factor 3 subunit B [Condylostylus longicornis]
MAKKKNEEYSGESGDDADYGEEPNFDDPEDFVDDVSDEELLGDLLSKRPCETDGMENVVVVDNIPKVAPARQEKLKTVIDKLFSTFGEIVNTYYPLDEEENTKGYAFLEYKNSQNAETAQKQLNNHRLDKSYTFSVNLFTDLAKYENVPEEWEPPKPQPNKIQNDLYNFLLEPDAYDQYCVAAETAPNSVQVQFWQNTLPEPTELESRERFTDTFVKWSPLGTYIVTFHKPGVAIWGGTEFNKINKFPHPGTQFVDFSPCENYLVTYGPLPKNQQNIIIWDIRSGQEKRSFVSENMSSMSMFKWSHDDKYVATMGTNVIHIYETPSFYLLDMKSIKIPQLMSFSWSPTDNIIAYWVAETEQVPAKVALVYIPKRREIRTVNIFNVSDCKIHWQKSGDHLCVKADRYTKKSKKDNDVKYLGPYHTFQIFDMRTKDVPVDSVDIKDLVLAFSWEPVGTKCAIIHGEQSNASISFYEVKKGQQPNLIKKMDKKTCSHLFWSPRGQFIVLANLTMGTFEFVDTNNDFIVMGSGDHFRASEVEWDPTGRYVVTGVSSWKVKEDTGYNMWSFQGRIVRRTMLKNFVQFLWRPRPPSLLTEAQQKEIKKNLKKYYPQFENKDRLRMTRASKELLEKRAQLREQFMEYRNKRIQEWKDQKNRRLQLRNHIDTDTLATEDVEEEIVEFLVKEELTTLE